MTSQWGRRISVTVGEEGVSQGAIKIDSSDNSNFRVDFNITKTRSSTPNKATVRIYNLPPGVRSRATSEYDAIIVQAGYSNFSEKNNNTFGVIFKGQIVEVEHSRQGEDVVSSFSCVDGGLGYVNGVVNMTYKKNSLYRDIISDIVSGMERVSLGSVVDVPVNARIPRDRNFFGTGKESIDLLCRNINCRATVNNGLLNIVSNEGGDRAVRSIPKISKDSGMIGSPSSTEKGISVSCLLNPNIAPNTFVEVVDEVFSFRKKQNTSIDNNSDSGQDSENKKTVILNETTGVYRVNSMVLSGSTHTNEFLCRIEGQKSDGYRVVRPRTLDRDSTALSVAG